MATQKHNLKELKEMFGSHHISSKKIKYFAFYSGGFPQSSLIELTGLGKTEFVVNFLKENSNGNTAWIEPQMATNPHAMWQRGVALDKFVFIECGETAAWSIQQVLKSQLFQVVVLSRILLNDNDLRKIQLLIEKVEIFLFLLNEQPHKGWIPMTSIDTSAL